MQTSLWSVLYLVYGDIVLISLVQFARANLVAMEIASFASRFRFIWFIQAMVLSALLLVVTHYLTLDVVNLPLLWVAPLSIYLITFIVCFLFPTVSKPSQARTAIAVLSLLWLMLTSRPEMGLGLTVRILSALACLCVCAWYFTVTLNVASRISRAAQVSP